MIYDGSTWTPIAWASGDRMPVAIAGPYAAVQAYTPERIELPISRRAPPCTRSPPRPTSRARPSAGSTCNPTGASRSNSRRGIDLAGPTRDGAPWPRGVARGRRPATTPGPTRVALDGAGGAGGCAGADDAGERAAAVRGRGRAGRGPLAGAGSGEDVAGRSGGAAPAVATGAAPGRVAQDRRRAPDEPARSRAANRPSTGCVRGATRRPRTRSVDPAAPVGQLAPASETRRNAMSSGHSSSASTSSHGHSSVNWLVVSRSWTQAPPACPARARRWPPGSRPAAARSAPSRRYSAAVGATRPSVRPSGAFPGCVCVTRTA